MKTLARERYRRARRTPLGQSIMRSTPGQCDRPSAATAALKQGSSGTEAARPRAAGGYKHIPAPETKAQGGWGGGGVENR